MPWRSQATCPWLCLSVFFRTNTQLSRWLSSAVTFGSMEGRTPFSLEIVRTTLPFSSHTITVHGMLVVLQVNWASSPRRTVSVWGDSFSWASTARSQKRYWHKMNTLANPSFLNWVWNSFLKHVKIKLNGNSTTDLNCYCSKKRFDTLEKIFAYLLLCWFCVEFSFG